MKKTLIALAFAGSLLAVSAHAAPTCPAELDKTACVYFKEGYAAGLDDAKAGMKNAYQRHEDSYDSRFETAFAKGYEKGFAEGQKK